MCYMMPVNFSFQASESLLVVYFLISPDDIGAFEVNSCKTTHLLMHVLILFIVLI